MVVIDDPFPAHIGQFSDRALRSAPKKLAILARSKGTVKESPWAAAYWERKVVSFIRRVLRERI